LINSINFGTTLKEMGKIQRWNFTFLYWIGDHSPRHVHIYWNERLVAKWDLDNSRVIEGRVNRRVRKILHQLVKEGRL